MAYPTEERFKNLQKQVSEQPDNVFAGHSIEDAVFHGVVKEVIKDSQYTFAWLKVTPYIPYDPPQDGSLVFEKLGDDPLDDATNESRYDKVFVINLAPQLTFSYFQPGQRVTYWHYSGVGNQTDLIRGTYVTLWVGPDQRILHLTAGNPGSGTYSAIIMTGPVQIAAGADLFMPAGMNPGGQAIAINLGEDGTSNSHQISTPSYVVGTLCGSTTANTGDPTYPIFAVESPVPDTFWAKLNASTTAQPYHYGWVEQQLSGGAFSDKPAGRSGTTSNNFAVNALDPGFYGPILLDVTPDDIFVRMTSRNNTNVFDSPPILRCGYARTDGNTPTYGLGTPNASQRTTSHLELWPDDFKIVRSSDTDYLRRDNDTSFLWLGFDAKTNDGSCVGGGPFKVLQLKQPGPTPPPGTPCDIYWNPDSNSSPRCPPATAPLNVGNLELAGKVYVAPLQVSGCMTPAADTTTIAFGQGLSVSNGGGTASVEINLVAGQNIKIEDYGCAKKISVDPIVTKTFVTGISATANCNGDGTITVTITTTTDTINGLG